MTAKFHGIIAYPVTPFKPNGEVDTALLAVLVEQLIERGVHAIAPLGSTGESAYLSESEWQTVAEVSLQQVAGRVPTLVGISELTTQVAVQRAKFAERSGADAVMVLPMSYWKLSEREILQHYGAIAAAISLPIMVYNNPATSGIDLSSEFIVQMANAIPNITMVKESTGDIQRMHRLQTLSNCTLPFYNGSNPLALAALKAGASGWCTAAPHLIPDLTLALYQAISTGDLASAQQLFDQQLPLLRFLVSGHLPATIKAGLKLLGLDVGVPRLPLLPLEKAAVQNLEALLHQVRTQPTT
ncbi:MAG: dihydrodipicolinate synthase family protein [Stenomitos rutilans HA7619-LM2]|jgi:4-hydroxy-tetrahydrodipicolinate synthase|nr:dihydrodipicolinate synthase family protein [Stenomitos rutilans HA7619-LM2]